MAQAAGLGCGARPPDRRPSRPTDAGEAARALLTGGATLLRLAPGAAMVRAGDPATHLFVVRSGLLKSCQAIDAHRRITTQFWHANDIVAGGRGEQWPSDIEATVRSVVCRVPRGVALALAQEHPSIRSLLDEAAAARLEAVEQYLMLLRCRTAPQRLARFLLILARRQAWHADRGVVAWLPMSQSDIGDCLGISAETVCRVLAAFRDQGLVGAKVRGFVPLLDPRGLHALAQFSREAAAAA